MRRLIVYFIALLIFLSGGGAGILVATKNLFPMDYLRELRSFGYGVFKLSGNSGDSDASAYMLNLDTIFNLSTEKSIDLKRSEIVAEFHSADCLKNAGLAPIDVQEPAFREGMKIHPNLILEIKHRMNFITKSRLYRGLRGGSKLVLYHTGHGGQTNEDARNIKFLVDSGIDVVEIDLPLIGDNSRPYVQLKNIGRVQLVEHNQLEMLESSDFNPLALFVEPAACLVNYFSALGHYKSFVQIGFSGGGHVATLNAAFDTRISRTYSVAGTAPMFLRFANPLKYSGDYEQTSPWLIRRVSDLDLYMMASVGSGRAYIQIYNRFDPCCYDGLLSDTYKEYVRDHVVGVGNGGFDVWIDESTGKHELSIAMLRRIMKDF